VSKARALADGRDYVLPDDVQAVATAVLAHRLILGPKRARTGRPPSSSFEKQSNGPRSGVR
jgi:MoxR-like ATPase